MSVRKMATSSTSPGAVSKKKKAHRISSAPTMFAVNESELEEGSARPLLNDPDEPRRPAHRSRSLSKGSLSKDRAAADLKQGGDGTGGEIIDQSKVPTKNKLGTFMGVFVPAVVSDLAIQ